MSNPPSRRRLSGPAVVAVVLTCAACGDSSVQQSHIAPVYDKNTGRLKQLKYDSNGDGTVDTVSAMDGSRVLRIEIDKDQDGKVERWEYYGEGQKLEKVGFSRANDGRETGWSYADADGAVVRVEVAAGPDPKVISRIEHYEKELPSRIEEDTNADGKIDKWERYAAGRLSSVTFDSTFRGTADRRLVYQSDGSVIVEVDPDGDGAFGPAGKVPPTR